jgi:zinc D-Ala-D-Ala dipeptidase
MKMLSQIKSSPAVFIVISLLFIHFSGQAQSQIASTQTIRDKETYLQSIQVDPNQQMVNLADYMKDIRFDLRYKTTMNFTGKQLYPKIKTTYARLPVAQALGVVQESLREKGLGLKIFDAYRPYMVTVQMWNLIQDERYVAKPDKGSAHNRGTAVDLTIIELATGKALDMGTDFDNFTEKAHHDYTALSDTVLQNRRLLKSLMEKAGFRAYAEEWWHYSFASGSFPVMDLTFKQLK